MTLPVADIRKKIRSGSLPVAVVGLGWMGLPTVCLLADAGAKVIGSDTNPRVVEGVNKGIPTLPEPGLPQLLKRLIREGKIKATTSTEEAVRDSAIIFIIVPTLIDRQKKPDYMPVENASKEVGKSLQENSLIIFESTCGPGVTEKIVKRTIEKHSGLEAGEKFGLAYSPIRAMSGSALKDLSHYVRIVGGFDNKSLEVASEVLRTFVRGEIHKVRDLKTAESAKLFETIYRDTNIALANEFAMFCEKIGIDYAEVMRAANTQPYSHLHSPGIGVGGHCLPVYPYLLEAEANEVDENLKLIKVAREINDGMPKHTLRLVASGLRASGKPVARSRVTILGIGYRQNAKEIRFSPAIELIELLKRRGARVTVFDPKYTSTELKQLGYETKPTLKMSVEKADCVVLAVAHDEFKQLRINDLLSAMNKQPVIVDGAHTYDPTAIEKAGAVYRGIGTGTWTK
jgi:nucleotide sugar dehydrogenase